MLGQFTYPAKSDSRFIVADLVNVTWDIAAPVISLLENCGNEQSFLEGEIILFAFSAFFDPLSDMHISKSEQPTIIVMCGQLLGKVTQNKAANFCCSHSLPRVNHMEITSAVFYLEYQRDTQMTPCRSPTTSSKDRRLHIQVPPL
jgi:hypothetical protein